MTSKNFNQKICSVIYTAFILFLNHAAYCQVSAWEGTITIPTYGWQEDINPKFWAMEGGPEGSSIITSALTYPYSMQDHLSRKLEDRTYKALFLENEYLKITCLPELGGRLHSVYDKTTGEEVFHKNNVIKPSMIAMRGAFISGGVEWNAGPQNHTVTVVSPVDALIGKNDDGSAYIEVSNIEKSLRTHWTVRVTLHPGKAYLDERIRIYNPTDAMNPYYFWNCTAFPQLPGTRFIYPMSLGTDHFGIVYFNWPIHNGKDLSWTRNYEDASSIFAVNCSYDFFGAYDVDLDRGVIMYANYHEHSGKKAWTWGQGEYGRVSQQNLTDTDGNYIEVQSGPLPTQSDYGLLTPRSAVSWQEYWFPVHGLGTGFEYATRDIAFQVSRNNKNLEIRMIVTGVFEGVTCKIMEANKLIHQEQLNLSPESARVINVKTSGSPVIIQLEGKNGELIADFTTPLPVPQVTPPGLPSWYGKPDEQLSVQELYLKGQKSDRALNRTEARKYYQKALSVDSLYAPALRDLGILDYEAGLYDTAAEKFRRTLEQKPNDDGLTWYFLGLCNLHQKNFEEAIECGFKASRCFGTISSGFDLIGRSYMLSGNPANAMKFFTRAFATNPDDDKTFHHYLLALYASGQSQLAEELTAERNVTHPTDLVSSALTAIMYNKLADFASEVRSFLGEIDFEMIEASLTFSDLMLYEEAACILETACVQPVPADIVNPLVLYYIAYYHAMNGEEDKASKYLLMASKNYPDLIFASRLATIDILEYAISNNPADANALYQLGNLMGSLGRLEEAAGYWSRAVDNNPDNSVAWRNLGLYSWMAKKDNPKAEHYFREAIKVRPEDQTLYRDLAEVLTNKGAVDDAIGVLENMPFEGVRRYDIIINLAQAYLAAERYDDCVNLLLSTPYFVNWEGSSITWNIYNKACIQKGVREYDEKNYTEALKSFEMALSWPENLNVGRSERTGEAEGWYWKGKTLMALGRSKDATAAWKEGANTPGGSKNQEKYRELCRENVEL
ncbi:MAG: hypothetical protein AMS27_06955 [Bacteroides sp. SM23_62_1]|nr:MAG: hypothetical protein AMS27_06955 [Bacteroides sp. SM23_62_1]